MRPCLGSHFVRSVVAKVSGLLVLLLGREREAEGAGVAAVQTQGLLKPLLLQTKGLGQVRTQLLRRLALVALVVAVVAQGVDAVLLV